MTEFCEALDKLATVRGNREQTKLALDETTAFLRKATPERLSAFYDKLAQIAGVEKTAAPKVPRPGLIKRVMEGAEGVGKTVRPAGEWLGEKLLGPDSPHIKTMGDIAHGIPAYAPHALAGMAALRGYQHLSALSDSPAGRTLKTFIPGTPEYQQKSQELAYQYSGNPFPMGY